MRKSTVVVLWVVGLIAVVVGVDLLFVRDHFWERLMANVGTVLVFGVCHLRFNPPSDCCPRRVGSSEAWRVRKPGEMPAGT
jgi:hypothetical protein